MKLLFVGDVVGEPGRRVVQAQLRRIRAELGLDFVVVNAENAAGGFGVTEKIAREFFVAGADALTTGNHVWDRRETLDFIRAERRLLRPHNYPAGTPGSGWYVGRTAQGAPVGVLNVMGQVHMQPVLDCPFTCADSVLAAKPDEIRVVLVDFHAEATSEKTAMGWHLDGRVSAVVGSHTHIPTADERVLPGGTAYITDAGMAGCFDSVIGMDKEKALRRLARKLPERYEPAEGRGTLCGVVIDVDEDTGKARSIRRLMIDEQI